MITRGGNAGSEGSPAFDITVRRSGRPSLQASQELRERIVEAAMALFFAEGYGVTTMDAVAQRAQIAKRTLYHRFRDKKALFAAVAHHVLERLRRQHPLLPGFDTAPLPEALTTLACQMLHASLTPEALALHRLIIAEALRFPDLAAVMQSQTARGDLVKIIVARLRGCKPDATETAFLHCAEQFLQVVVAYPQRLALFGETMDDTAQAAWCIRATGLFLQGWQAVK